MKGISAINALGLNIEKNNALLAKTNLKINYISAKDNFLFYLITFTIEVINIKNKIGFIKLVDEKDTIIGLIEIDLKDSSFKKELSFLKTDLVTFKTKTVKAKLICDGQIAETKFFELGPKENKTCYCNRDFTVVEMQNIVIGIRENTFYNNQTIYSYHGDKLFYEESELSEKQKTYNKLAQVLNDTFKKYEINTCMRKRHFLAQAYWETGFFTRLKEIGQNLIYDPYRGRGFMQLTGVKRKDGTWVSGVEDSRTCNATAYLGYQYYSGLDVVNNPDLISNSIYNAADSGGWFWLHGKVLEDGSIKNINLVADIDNFDLVCLLVNGGKNGKKERTDAYNALKKIMPYENCKNKK